MSNKNTLELTKIEGLELNSVNYGENLNVRLNNIEDNFKKITQFDYIKGAPGDSYGSRTIKLNEGDDLTKKIATIIADNNTAIIDYVANNIKGRELVEFYKIVNDKETVTSILPFVYQDPAYAELASTPDNKMMEFKDKSCVILYNPENCSFFKTQTNPTIYYNTGEGAFCWKIGGTKTNLICQGPKGNDGKNGSLYIAKVGGKDKNTGTYIINEILYNTNNSIAGIPPEGFEEYFGFEGGESILCISGKEVQDENGNPVIDMTDVETFISPIQIISKVDGKKEYQEYHVSKKYGCFHFDKIENLNALKILLDQVGLTPGLLKGLFVPACTDDTTEAHMMWDSTVTADSTPTANIGVVKDVTKPEPVEGGEGIFNVNYKTTNFNDINVNNLTIRGSNLGQRYAENPLLIEYKEGDGSALNTTTYYSTDVTIDANEIDGNLIPYTYIITQPTTQNNEKSQYSTYGLGGSAVIPGDGGIQYLDKFTEVGFNFKGKLSINDNQLNPANAPMKPSDLSGYSISGTFYAYVGEVDPNVNDNIFTDISNAKINSDGEFEFNKNISVYGLDTTQSEQNQIDTGNLAITIKYLLKFDRKIVDENNIEWTESYYREHQSIYLQSIFLNTDGAQLSYPKPIDINESHTNYEYDPKNNAVDPNYNKNNSFDIKFINYQKVGEEAPIWNKSLKIYNQTDKSLSVNFKAHYTNGDKQSINYTDFDGNKTNIDQPIILGKKSHISMNICDVRSYPSNNRPPVYKRYIITETKGVATLYILDNEINNGGGVGGIIPIL